MLSRTHVNIVVFFFMNYGLISKTADTNGRLLSPIININIETLFQIIKQQRTVAWMSPVILIFRIRFQ